MADPTTNVEFNPLDLLQNFDGCLIAVNPETEKILFTNASACEILKYNYNQLIQMSYVELFPPLRQKEISGMLKELRQNKSQIKASFDIPLVKQSSENYLAKTLVTCANFHGKTILLTLSQDVKSTELLKKELLERQKNETETLKYQENLEELIMRKADELHIKEKIVEQALDGIAMFDMNRTIIYANESWIRMHQLAMKDIIGANLSIVHTKEQMYNDVNPVIEQALYTGPFEREIGHCRKNGVPFPTLSSMMLLLNDKDERIGIVEFTRDITEKKLAEESLIHERNFLNNIIELNPYAIAIFDAEGHFLRANQACFELFNFSPPTEYNLFADPVIAKSGFQEEFAAIKNGFLFRLSETKIALREINPHLPDKTVIFGLVGFPIFDNKGRFENLIIIFEKKGEEKRS